MTETFKPCSVSGCDSNAHRSARGCRGWCSAHYQRWRKYGSPHGGSTAHGEPLQWIHEVAAVHADDACLPWPFACRANGYGHVQVDGKMRPAHRVVCEVAHGPAPSPDHETAHSCGNGNQGCVNGQHLRWATRAENMKDCAIHGTDPRGSRNGRSKLTETDVLEIRRQVSNGVPQKDMAIKFGLRPQSVSCIIRGKSWAWLEDAS